MSVKPPSPREMESPPVQDRDSFVEATRENPSVNVKDYAPNSPGGSSYQNDAELRSPVVERILARLRRRQAARTRHG